MSYEDDIKSSAVELENLLKKYKPSFEKISDNIIKICDQLEKSWSGSWIGYHANLYFKDYTAPLPRESFSIEWGGINGYDPGWQPRGLDDVWDHIINKSTKKFDIDDIDKKLTELQESATSLKTLYELNSSNQVLADKIKKIDTDFTMHDYIKVRKPTTIVSRDSEAVYQGMKLPPHIQCQAFAHTIKQNIIAAEKLLKLKPLILNSDSTPSTIRLMDDELSHLNPKLVAKVGKLYADKHYSDAVGRGFMVVKDRLRNITGSENGFPAFEEKGLHIKGSAAPNVDEAFQEAVKRLLGSIDKFRNEKYHTSEANLKDKNKALSYLHLCSLALSFIENNQYTIKSPPKKPKPGLKTET